MARHCFSAVFGIVIWLSWIYWPQPADTGLDASWQLVLGYAHVHHWQFGTDFVFTHGPWSYLNVIHCYAPTYWQSLVWQMFFKAVVTFVLVMLAMRLPVWRAVLFFLAAALLLPQFEDVAPVLLIICAVTAVAAANQIAPGLLVAASVLLAFVALQKFTYGVMIGFGATGVVVILGLQRRWRDVLLFALPLVGGVCLFWIAAGQQISGLPVYAHRSWMLASGYADAMALDETPAVFWCGIVTAVAAAVAILFAACRTKSSRRSVRLVLALIGVGFAFMIWKQSFVRADGHVVGFFLCAIAAGLLLRPMWSGTALAIVAFVGLAIASPSQVIYAPQLLRLRLTSSLLAVTEPAKVHAAFLAQTRAAAAAAELKNIRTRIGTSSVDVFGDDHAFAVLNDLPYTARPVFQTHQAYSAALAELNANFYRGPTAPQYVLARLQTIDDRFVSEDDARVLPILLRNYQAVLEEKGWLSLQRNPVASHVAFEPLLARRAQFGHSVTIPTVENDVMLAVAVNVRETLLGRLRAFLYKPAELRLSINDGTARRSYRLVRPAAAGAFLVRPLLRDEADLPAFFRGGALARAEKLTVEIEPAARKFYRNKFAVTFFASPLRDASD